jgi:hypothetical protein
LEKRKEIENRQRKTRKAREKREEAFAKAKAKTKALARRRRYMKKRKVDLRLKAEKEKEEQYYLQSADRATQVEVSVSKKTVKKLRELARFHNIKGRSKAKTKIELIQLLNKDYAKRRQAVYDKRFGAWESDVRANEETIRWQQEISEEIALREKKLRAKTTPPKPKLIKSALNGKVQKWFVSGKGYKDPNVFLFHIENGVKKVVDNVSGPRKVSAVLVCYMMKETAKTGFYEVDKFGARSRTHTITVRLGDVYYEMIGKMLESISKFQKNGSGWRLKSIVGLEFSIVKFNPLDGSGYSKLPPTIVKKKAIINMRNERREKGDEQCECDQCAKCVLNGR